MALTIIGMQRKECHWWMACIGSQTDILTPLELWNQCNHCNQENWWNHQNQA